MAGNASFCKAKHACFLNLFAYALIYTLTVTFVSGATTTPPTPAATTTTTPVPTTTTPPPTTTQVQTAPVVPKTVIGASEIGECLCDLTGNGCDINCCCDVDCTDLDKEAFTCNPVSVVIDDKLCYQSEVFMFSNSPASTETTDDGLFCIIYDNYGDRNFYKDPDFVADVGTFNEYLDDYGSPSVQQAPAYTEPEFTFNSYYVAGDPMYIIYQNEARGMMVLPTPLVSNECTDQNTMSYLQDVTNECTRDVTLANECTTNAVLGASAYYANFRLVTLPGLFGYVENGTLIEITTQAPVVTTTTPSGTTVTTVPPVVPTTPAPQVNASLVQNLYDNPYTIVIAPTLPHLCLVAGSLTDCPFTTIPAPSLNGESCSNVTIEVRYTITTNGTVGITEASVQFVFADVTPAEMPLAQRFSVTYKSIADSGTPAARSGNPGYVFDKPLLYGEMNTTSYIITPKSLTVVGVTTDGKCDANKPRQLVKFGQDMRTGCTITLDTQINAVTCQTIQTEVVKVLEGLENVPTFDGTSYVDNHRYVATFGNTDVVKIGDWVKILVNKRPIPTNAEVGGVPVDTCRLSLGLHIQILYASVGALANPQYKIIGVALLYDSVQDIKFRCTGAFCQDAAVNQTQAFEVSQSVSFVDVSQPAVAQQGEAPVFISRVPNDFFYPFLYYTNGAISPTTIVPLLPVICSLLLTLFLNLQVVWL